MSIPSETISSLSASAVRKPLFAHRDVLRVVWGIMPAMLLAGLDQMVILPVLPSIGAELGNAGGLGALSWVVTAYLLTSTAATPIWGKLSDVWGRRVMLMGCTAVFGLASVACALSGALWQLILARALQGLGGAGLVSIAQSAVADVVSPRERGRYQIYIVSTWAIAGTLGPIVGGYLSENLSWRWVFWINVPLSLIALTSAGLALRIIPPRRQKRPLDLHGALLIFFASGAALLALQLLGRNGAVPVAQVMGLVAGAVVLGALLYGVERRHADPVILPRLLGNPVYLGGLAIGFLNSLGLFAASFMVPLHFTAVIGTAADNTGLLMAPMLGSNAVAAFIGGQTVHATGRIKPVVILSVLLSVAGFAMLALMGAAPLWLVLLATVLIGLGTGGAMPTILILSQNAAETRDIGAATGTLMLTRAVGGAIGVAIVAAMVSYDPSAGQTQGGTVLASLSLAYGVCGGLMATTALIAFLMRDEPLRAYAAAESRRDDPPSAG